MYEDCLANEELAPTLKSANVEFFPPELLKTFGKSHMQNVRDFLWFLQHHYNQYFLFIFFLIFKKMCFIFKIKVFKVSKHFQFFKYFQASYVRQAFSLSTMSFQLSKLQKGFQALLRTLGNPNTFYAKNMFLGAFHYSKPM